MDLDTFPLIWRWTQPSHAVLPAQILGELRPLMAQQIEVLHLRCNSPCDPTIALHRATEDANETSQWLASLPISAGRVIAVWNKDTALSLPWDTFVKYWDDFCYPSSDDVEIFAEDGALLLKWRHDEIFEHVVDAAETDIKY